MLLFRTDSLVPNVLGGLAYAVGAWIFLSFFFPLWLPPIRDEERVKLMRKRLAELEAERLEAEREKREERMNESRGQRNGLRLSAMQRLREPSEHHEVGVKLACAEGRSFGHRVDARRNRGRSLESTDAA